MTGTDAVARIAELRAAEAVDPGALDVVWAGLVPVRAEDVLGRWRGAVFATGHPLCGLLVGCRWYGKYFDALDDAKPLMCRAEDGVLFSNRVLANGGEASLWNVEFRGEVTATMVYDAMPIADHFKRVDEDTLLGVMNGKDAVLHNGHHFYFLLERQS